MSDQTPPAEPAAMPPAPVEEPTSTITDAAKLIRLGTMTQSLMAEAREAPLDEGGRALLAKINPEQIPEPAEPAEGGGLD